MPLGITVKQTLYLDLVKGKNHKVCEIQLSGNNFFKYLRFAFVQCGTEDTGDGNASSVVRRCIMHKIRTNCHNFH